jgi:segregation and condensation protein B
MISISAQIESILFVKTEGVKVSYLATLLHISNDEVKASLDILHSELTFRGLQLLRSGDTVMLVTHSDMSHIIQSLFEEETGGELTPASLQTLSIIAYKGIATRGEVSYIRGVDSRMSLRNLSLRGLVEKSGSDSYRPTTDCLRFLGVTSVEELPRFRDIHETLKNETTKRRGE